MRTAGDAPVRIHRLSEPLDFRAELAADVMTGMTGTPKSIPSKYFYDGVGSDLFEEITLQPEYYLTRAETDILLEQADDIMDITGPSEIVEIGSGSSIKTRLLIEAMHRAGTGRRYVPIDISEDALTAAAQELCGAYTWLTIDGLIGDFNADLPKAPRLGKRLVIFLGSTIGNLEDAERTPFLRSVRSMLSPEDHFLLGVDLVKDVPTMVAAYDDAAGVTEAFTKNILTVVNRELDADFDVTRFDHVPVWNEAEERMEAWLRATEAMEIKIHDLNLAVHVEAGEEIFTEVSCKFTRDSVERMFAGSGLEIAGWLTDPDDRFALVVAKPSQRTQAWSF